MEKHTQIKIERIAITGPTGAIGIAIIKEMIKHNIEVLAICNPNSKRISRIPDNPLVKVVLCDLDELEHLKERELLPCDVFYHLGWAGTFGNIRNDMFLQNHNVFNSLKAVHLAKELGCHTFIGAGSQAEYGRVDGVLSPDTPTFPENGYGIAKLAAGQMTRIECEKLGMKHIWFRVLSIYGPYDGEKTLIMSTIHKLLNGETPQTTKGEQMWDYLYSEDAGRAFYLAGKCGKGGAVYCLGSGNARPLKEYILTMKDVISPASEIDFGAIEYSPKQVMYLCADISNLQRDTGFIPTTNFKKGIEKTVQWYKEQLEKKGNEKN